MIEHLHQYIEKPQPNVAATFEDLFIPFHARMSEVFRDMLNRPETKFSRAYNFDQLCLPNFGRTPWTGKIVSKSKARAVITSGLDIMDPFYVLYLTQDLVVWSRQIGPSPAAKQMYAQNREMLVTTLIGWMGW